MRSKPSLQSLSVLALVPGRFQPRKDFSKSALDELAASIEAQGLIQPIVVRPLADDKEAIKRYEIIARERRWRAVQLLDWIEVNCLVCQMEDQSVTAVSLVENLSRDDLNSIEIAEGYAQLIKKFDYTHEIISALCGVSRAKVSNSLRLLSLIEPVKEHVIAGQFSEGDAKVLSGLNAYQQKNYAALCLRHQWSVRQLEEKIHRFKRKVPKTCKAAIDLDVQRLEAILSKQLNTTVCLDLQAQGGGWLKIRFYSNETLARILAPLALDYD